MKIVAIDELGQTVMLCRPLMEKPVSAVWYFLYADINLRYPIMTNLFKIRVDKLVAACSVLDFNLFMNPYCNLN